MPKVLPIEKSLALLDPELVKQWHPTKNVSVSPSSVSPGSAKKVWWVCQKGHEWETAVNKRALLSRGCPFCTNRKACKETSLQSTFPELAKQWHPTKNCKSPENVLAHSHYLFWWKCSEGHEWEARAHDRIRKGRIVSCPVCRELRPRFDAARYHQEYYYRDVELSRSRSDIYRSRHFEEIRSKRFLSYATKVEAYLWRSSKSRAKKKGLPFSISLQDILDVVPLDRRCPITKEAFESGIGHRGPHPNSMSLDRIIPSLGYIRGNIAVISHKANTMKSCCTDPGVFRLIANYLRSH